MPRPLPRVTPLPFPTPAATARTASRTTGTVVSVKLDKGFGFIRISGERRDVFFHFRDLAPDLLFDETLVEQRVEFREEQTEKGPRAVAIKPVL